jgi:dolichyl-phosphate beta-glucosyltransferase
MRASMPGLTIVVPCYNEAGRLDGGPLLAFLDARPEARLIFVDDGSEDATADRLSALKRERPGRIDMLSLQPNRGKAEAVRQGMLAAMDGGAVIVGYLDADLSTPPTELSRLLDALARPGVEVVLAARVVLLGSDIHRSVFRHYLGRVFASAASLILKAPIYDTQCGAKLFRSTGVLRAALSQPFLSRWAFDVELIGRLLAGNTDMPPLSLAAIVEVPLSTWRDVAGSKLGPMAMARSAKDLALIGADLAARRRAVKSRSWSSS